METQVKFHKSFSRSMAFLAVITGIIISISMPITYFWLNTLDEKELTEELSRSLSRELQEVIKVDPRIWKYNAHKFTSVFADYQNDRIIEINVLDESYRPVYKETLENQSLIRVNSVWPIVYNNHSYGYVEIVRNANHVVGISAVLLLVFTALGLMVGIILYRYPAAIIAKSEMEVATAINRLNHLSYHDSLTNLPNRKQLYEKLSEAIYRAEHKQHMLALLFLDLDRFKLINDTLGHHVGDAVLKIVAEQLADCLREGDIVARLGGDEFIILLPEISDVLDASKVAQRIIKALSQPFVLNSRELTVSTSIGISVYPKDGDNVESIIMNADTAMYRAKGQGNNIFRFYSHSMNAGSLERLELEIDLRKSLTRGELCLHYQPIIDLRSGEIIGTEALVRWMHPKYGLIPPDRFIPLAEETELIIRLGDWVIRTACIQNKIWQDSGCPPIYISVNLSGRQFRQHGLTESIERVLHQTKLEPNYLQLEITESIASYDHQGVISKLQGLRELGVRVAIDDFGTGYSSLGSLKKFPLNTLKIDKSFIDNITKDTFDAAITTTIISLAKSLHLNIIAEGVESEEQSAFLLKQGCDAIQGYLFSRPVSAKEFEHMLRKGKRVGQDNESNYTKYA